MQNKTAAKKKSYLPRLMMLIFTLAIIGLFAWNLPRGYSSDLSQIGKGKNVVVQVHDHYLVASSQLMEQLQQLRDEYAGAIEFIIADMQIAEGKAFAKTYNVDAVSLLFFAPDGKHVRTVHGVQELDDVRRSLNVAFNLNASK
ncbi:MAG: hypothetical protein HY081_02055 [Gammaproteobacteria bacterium]|nr:hypothetical protein [Gammaproteobacteria bacterium]